MILLDLYPSGFMVCQRQKSSPTKIFCCHCCLQFSTNNALTHLFKAVFRLPPKLALSQLAFSVNGVNVTQPALQNLIGHCSVGHLFESLEQAHYGDSFACSQVVDLNFIYIKFGQYKASNQYTFILR